VFVADVVGYAPHVIAMFRVTVISSSCVYCGFINHPFRFSYLLHYLNFRPCSQRNRPDRHCQSGLNFPFVYSSYQV
jgi:hypothetical protein